MAHPSASTRFRHSVGLKHVPRHLRVRARTAAHWLVSAEVLLVSKRMQPDQDRTGVARGSTLQSTLIRAIDLVAAISGGVVTLPILLIVAFLVRLDSPGPALFRQNRVGRNEVLFVCYKLRTMAEGAPVVGTHEISGAHVTSIGRWLRRLKLDELPQLWNVIRGEMSLVGPRPCLPSQLELIEARRAHGVYGVRPGVTGPSQVIGLDMSTPRELAEKDAIWTRAPNLKDYVRLIILTVLGKGQGDAIRA